MDRLRVVIVDDERLIGQLVSRLIHYDELGMELLGVFDESPAACSCILENHPDVVISDIKMPEMDGLELIRRIQEAGLHPHFLLISGFREFEYAHEAIKYGVEDYLLKPVNEEELNEVLRKVGNAHSVSVQQKEELENLRRSAARSRTLAGRDAVAMLTDERSPADLAQVNELFHLELREGKAMAFVLRLDCRSKEWVDPVQERVLLNHLISRSEKHLSGQVWEQLYSIQESSVTGILNYEGEGAAVQRELTELFPYLREYISGFPEYEITMSIGPEREIAKCGESLREAQHRMRQRIRLGVNRVLPLSDTVSGHAAGRHPSPAELSRLGNSVDALSEPELTASIEEIMKSADAAEGFDPADYYTLGTAVIGIVFEKMERTPGMERERRETEQELGRCWTIPQMTLFLRSRLGELLNDQLVARQERSGRPVREAEEYIAAHYAEKISLEEVAELLHMNASYFSTLFKKETGRNFQTYLTDYRMEKAKEYLRGTDETMAAIAGMVGYTDTRYFSQTFAKVVGIKPSLYRRMYS